MKNILPLLFLLFSTMIFAQLPKSLIEPIEKTYPFGDDYTGSIYKNNNYKEASVIDEKSGTFDTKLKYNIYYDTLEYATASELFSIVKTPTIHIRIDGDYYYYCEFKNQRGLTKNGYYILVELNDKYRIYKKYILDITDPQSSGVVSVGAASRGSIKTRTKYYLEEDNVIMELSSKKKDILATFSDKKDELKKYIKKEKISLRKEDDLIRFIAKYNALKSVNSGPSRSLLSNRAQNN